MSGCVAKLADEVASGGEPSAPVGQQGFPLNCGGAGGTQEMLDGVTGEPGSIGRVGVKPERLR